MANDKVQASLSTVMLGTGKATALYLAKYDLATLVGVTQSDPEILSGTPVFVGTRVPVRSLFDYLEGGDTLEEFLHQFPAVKREKTIAILDAAYETITAYAHSA